MDKILDDREKRYYKILDLISKYSLPVICGKLNYPGSDKNTSDAEMGFKALGEVLGNAFRKYTVKEVLTEGCDGSAILLAVAMKPEIAKDMALGIEETHILGRIFDIDVYMNNGSPLSRTELGRKGRECIVCGNDARYCIKGERHSLREVVDCVNKLIGRCGQ